MRVGSYRCEYEREQVHVRGMGVLSVRQKGEDKFVGEESNETEIYCARDAYIAWSEKSFRVCNQLSRGDRRNSLDTGMLVS